MVFDKFSIFMNILLASNSAKVAHVLTSVNRTKPQEKIILLYEENQ